MGHEQKLSVTPGAKLPSSTLSTNAALAEPSATAAPVMDGRGFLDSWRSHIGEYVRFSYCTLQPAQEPGILCIFFYGPTLTGSAMLLGRSIKSASLEWARTTCHGSEPTTACSVGISGVVRDEGGPSLDEAVIHP